MQLSIFPINNIFLQVKSRKINHFSIPFKDFPFKKLMYACVDKFPSFYPFLSLSLFWSRIFIGALLKRWKKKHLSCYCLSNHKPAVGKRVLEAKVFHRFSLFFFLTSEVLFLDQTSRKTQNSRRYLGQVYEPKIW